MSKVHIFVDSGADLPNELLAKYDIKRLDMQVSINGKCYRDRVDIQPEDFFKLIEPGDVFPQTSQVSPRTMSENFFPILRNTDDDIIYLPLSSALSGTYQATMIFRENLKKPERLTVIDTKTGSLGTGIIAIAAAKAAQAGKTKSEIITIIDKMSTEAEIIFSVGNLEMLKRGGRIKAPIAIVGDLLNIKVLLHVVEGAIFPLDKVHGVKKTEKRLLEILDEKGYSLKKHILFIGEARAHEAAKEMQALIEAKFGVAEDTAIMKIGAVIGAHVGPGTVVLFFVRRPE